MFLEWLAKQRAKAALFQVFRNGELGVSYSYGQNKGKVYPKVHAVQFDQKNKAVIFTFTLPIGMDPKEIKKKEYCFKQVFGPNLEIKGDVKKFVLTVFEKYLPSELTYNYDSYLPYLKGKNLPIVTGVDINGKLIAFDMVKNPHLLIAGETGSGKSTQLRSILSTLIQTIPTDRLELYLCDLKRSEFHLFRQIKHVQGMYVSPDEMLPMLQYLQSEMKKRGNLLDNQEASHIDELPNPPAYIILCIDEVALLQKETKIMELVEEISAIGRALGVFLILSMQRPDNKVLDGKLKNNLTVRMGFKCADLINSRIIGTPGSEKLKDKGRLLLNLPELSGLREVQGPFLSLDEAKSILQAYKLPNKGKNKKTALKGLINDIDLSESDNNIFGVLDE